MFDSVFFGSQTEMYGSLKGLSGGPRQPSATVKTRRRKRWGGLRQKWKMLGLFPIDSQHEFHGLTCMMKDGLAAAIQSTIDTPPTVSRGPRTLPSTLFTPSKSLAV